MELSDPLIALIGAGSLILLVKIVGTGVAVTHLWRKTDYSRPVKLLVTPPLTIIPFAEYAYFSFQGIERSSNKDNRVPEGLL